MLSPQFVAIALAALAAVNGVSAVAAPNMRRQSTNRTTPLLTTFAGQAALPTLATLTAANSTGVVLDLTNIQGDILIGMKKPVENFYFFTITNATAFKQIMRSDVLSLVTSTATLVGPVADQPAAFVNVAFSQSGLTTLDVTDDLGDSSFTAGQFSGATALGDETSTWESAFQGTSIHGVFLVGSDDAAHIESTINPVITALDGAATIAFELDGAARPGDQAGHEHFGYLDGISNPGVAGFTNVTTSQLPGQSIVPTGVILTGRDGDSVTRPAWALDGSFLAFRKLQQLVPEYNKFTLDNAVQNAAGNLTVEQGAEIFGSRLIGRFRSGAPIDIVGEVDDPELGADPQRNNNFDYSDATDGEKCPFSAHIRKARPRDDLGNANVNNQAIRAGIPYGPEVTDAEASSNTTTTDRGLAFVMYQSNINNGFSFQQRIWVNNANFFQSGTGLDPIIGQDAGALRTFTGSNPLNLTQSFTQAQTVISNGGEYFFSPSISALNSTILALD